MIKKCKITNITNGIIYGVVKDPIRNGNILDLNSGQILRCMLEASVDEILSDNTLVRLNKTNYNKNNEKKKVNILEENKDTKVPEKAIPVEDKVPENVEDKKEEDKVPENVDDKKEEDNNYNNYKNKKKK